MKKLLFLLILIIPHIAQAQFACENSAQTTQYGTSGQCGPVAMDTKGNQYVTIIDGGGDLVLSSVPVSTSNPPVGGVGAGNVAWDSTLSDTAEASSTTTVINATSHAARIGDTILFYAGSNTNVWTNVTAIDTNTITVYPPLLAAPSVGNGFYILRPVPIFASNPATGSGAAMASFIDRAFQPAAASGILKAEDAAHSSGDAGVAAWGVNNRSQSTYNSTNGDYTPIGVGDYGELTITMSPTAQTFANSAIRAEDAAFADGSGVVMSGAVNNESLATSFNTTNGDVVPTSVGRFGDVLSSLIYNANILDTDRATYREDQVPSNASAGLKVFGLNQAAITSDAGDGDLGFPKQDMGGRQIVTGAPSGEMVVGCNTAITTATTGQVIAAVASKFTFITSWQCTNTGGAASRVILEDGDGTDLANLLVAATTGFAQVTFPTPVRTNVVNKAIQVNVITTGTSTICCASGYTGAI